MDLLNSSEISNTGFPILLFALVCTFSGSMWINYLYPKALQRSSLSFPEQIQQRARFRKPALFLALLLFFSKAWSMTAMPALPYIIFAISLLWDFVMYFTCSYPLRSICLHPLAVDTFSCFWHLSVKAPLEAVILN